MNVASVLVMMAVLLISTVATGQEVVDGFVARVQSANEARRCRTAFTFPKSECERGHFH